MKRIKRARNEAAAPNKDLQGPAPIVVTPPPQPLNLAYAIKIKPDTNGLYVLVTYEITKEGRANVVAVSVEDIRDMIMAKLNDALAIVPQL